MSNVGQTRMIGGGIDDENAILYRLPAAVRAFLEERSAVPFMPSQVAGYLRANGEAATLKRLREMSEAEMIKVFGKNYPTKEPK